MLSELNKLKDDVGSLKRSIKEIASSQFEMMRVVKALKKSHDSHNFEMGKCCHTVIHYFNTFSIYFSACSLLYTTGCFEDLTNNFLIYIQMKGFGEWHYGTVVLYQGQVSSCWQREKGITVTDTVMHIYSYLFAYKYIIFTSETHTCTIHTHCMIHVLYNKFIKQ